MTEEHKNKPPYRNVESLVAELVNTHTKEHNSIAKSTKGNVIVDLRHNDKQGHHLLQIIAPAEMNENHRGLASYTARFVYTLRYVDAELLASHAKTAADIMVQLINQTAGNMYIDFEAMKLDEDKLRKAQEESRRQQLINRTRGEGNRGISG